MGFYMSRGIKVSGLALLAAVVFQGCSAARTMRIAVKDRPVSIQPLVGQWHGDYVTDESSARQGSISFTLVAASNDSLHGVVQLTPAGADQPYPLFTVETPVAADGGSAAPVQAPSIQIVPVDAHTVTATLDPYWDPDRQSPAFATFEGHVRGEAIDGTFRTTYASHSPDTTGKWRVSRTTSK